MSKLTPARLLSAGLSASVEEPHFSSWFKEIKLKQNQYPATQPSIPLTTPKNMPRRRPSDSGHGNLLGAAFFSDSGGLALGTEIHDALAKIEWLPQDDFPKDVSSAAEDLLKKFLMNFRVQQLFTRTSPQAIVWRERSVVCLLDDTIISAQMDRVIICPPHSKQSKGKITLVDFKTDQGNPDEIAKRYSAQMLLYVRILEAWSQGAHDITAVIATIRTPSIIPIWPR